ncbi:hypothetical protein [Polymorphobacter fuscus]|uniref:Uncharacterized protein n=1 Tax=Sandarakinorhabdus fusca TaxID=1439888 RepID=A0A7C9LFI5_9SPHN|nr:hypothetical protein [Polymorphobacter fuscus]KAB7647469.1 hypothetical protein F9290_05575 [Polymorphobacter fuscus]MQT16727.1 hypothetical protein [Polymorphobacter fuscus]NJC09286.1 DNA-binding phage protein [Polymorphobacter fuscus]
MTDIAKARFLADQRSQILALDDALAKAEGPAISAAFDDVARTRGLKQIARDAHIPVAKLLQALADPCRPDCVVLRDVVQALADMHPDLRSQRRDPG